MKNMASNFLLGHQTSIDLREISIVPNVKTCLASREVNTCSYAISQKGFSLFNHQLGTTFHRIINLIFRIG